MTPGVRPTEIDWKMMDNRPWPKMLGLFACTEHRIRVEKTMCFLPVVSGVARRSDNEPRRGRCGATAADQGESLRFFFFLR